MVLSNTVLRIPMINMVQEEENAGGVFYTFEYPEGATEEERDLASDKAFQEAYEAQKKTRSQPVNSETTTEERNPSALENVIDATKAPASALKNVVFKGTETVERGVRKGLNVLGADIDESMIDIIDKKINDYTNLGFFRNNDKGDLVWTGSLEDVNNPDKSVTILPTEYTGTGKFVEGISRFLIPMGGIKKGLDVVGKGFNYSKWVAAGMMGEQLVFNPFEDRISNLIQEYPTLENPVTEYLQADPNDTEAEARFKMAVEALGIEALTFGAVGIVKAASKYSRGLKIDPEEETALVQWADSLIDPKKMKVGIKELETAVDSAVKNEMTLRNTYDAVSETSKAKQILSPETIQDIKKQVRLDAEDDLHPALKKTAKKTYNYGVHRTHDQSVKIADKLIAKYFVDSPSVRGVLKGIENEIPVKDFDKWVTSTGRLLQLTSKNFKSAMELRDLTRNAEIKELDEVNLNNNLTSWERLEALKNIHNKSAKAEQGFTKARNELMESIWAFRGASSTAGRSLNILQLFQNFDKVDPLDVEKTFNDLIKKAPSEQVRNSFIAKAIYHMEKGVGLTLRALDEIFISNVLSSFKTHMVNNLMNTVTAHYRPLERIVANGVRLPFSEQATKEFRASIKAYQGLYRYGLESTKISWDSYKMGRVFLDSNSTYENATQTTIGKDLRFGSEFTSKTLREIHQKYDLTPEGNLKTDDYENTPTRFIKEKSERTFGEFLADVSGTILRSQSTRALGAQDEFYKNLVFSSEVYGRAYADFYEEATEQGLKGKDRRGFAVAKAELEVRKAREEQLFSRLDTKAEIEEPSKFRAGALQEARKTTYTQTLGEGGQAFQNAVATIPFMRQIFPFIRTPLNLISESIQRSPFFHLASGRWRADWMAGGERRALAMVRAAQGYSVLVGLGIRLSTDENIQFEWNKELPVTGVGSKNPALARTEREIGGYINGSLIVNGTQYQITRFDPASTILEALGMITEMQKNGMAGDAENYFIGTMISLGSMLGNETYAKSIKQIMRAMEDTSGSGLEKFLIQRSADLAIPFSAQFRSINQGADPVVRDLRNSLDGIKATLPFLAKNVSPKYDALGRPRYKVQQWNPLEAIGLPDHVANMLMPISSGKVSEDPVAVAMVNHSVGSTLPSPFILNGAIDLKNPIFAESRTGVPLYKPMTINYGSKENPDTVVVQSPTAYDRLQQIIREDMNLYGELSELVREFNLDDFSDNIVITTPSGKKKQTVIQGSKKTEIQNIIRDVRQAAIGQLLDENPILSQERDMIESQLDSPNRQPSNLNKVLEQGAGN